MARLKVDFSKVEDSVTSVPAGKYVARVKEITSEKGKEYPYLKWNLQILSGKAKGLHINLITSFSPRALFRLRDTLVALGVNVPKSTVQIDTDKLIGRTLGIEVKLETRNGETYPEVKKVFSTKMEGVPDVTPAGPAARAPETVVDDEDDEMPFDVGMDEVDDMVLDLSEVED